MAESEGVDNGLEGLGFKGQSFCVSLLEANARVALSG